MEEKGFIITSHYEIKEENERKHAEIHLFGRLMNEKSFEIIVPYKPYFFIKSEDEKLAKEIINGKIEKTNLKTIKNEPVSKITIDNPKEVPQLRKILENKNIACYEADIRFTQRFLMDNNILSTIKIKGKEEKGDKTDIKFINPKIKPENKLNNEDIEDKIKILSFDIETDSKANKLFSLSIHQGNFKKVLIIENEKIKEQKLKDELITIVKDEKELIKKFISTITKLDPDIITGWHVIDFDLKILNEKAKQYNIPFLIGRTNNTLNLRIEKSFFRDSNAHVEGRLILDGIQLLKSSFIKLDDYKLNTAAKHFLNETKTIEENDRGKIIENQYYNEPKKLIEYNLQDSILVSKILDKSNVIKLTIQRSLLTGLHMDRVKASIASFDSVYLRELRKKGFVAESTRPMESDEGLGGFVMTSKPGIYNNILVLDFKSLYPSIMRTFNIDPLAYKGQKEELEKKEKNINDKTKFIIAPNNAVFENNEGILPTILKKLWDEREKAKQEKNELSRYAIKTLMNSMYGVLASQNSRFHNRNISNAITYFAQFIIKLSAKKAQEKNVEIIYGDTDSIFVNTKTTNKEKAKQIGFEIEKELNEFLEKYVKENYSRKSILEIEFEKQYIKFFMPKTRGSEKGAKKRYAGLVEKNGKSEIEFTGLEVVRRDWTELAKEFQTKLLEMIFNDKNVEEYIKQFVNDIKEGKFDKLLVYKKALRKNVEEYTKTTPPHVKAAKLLKEIKSNIIEYVITTEGPEPIENQKHKLNYEHYIEKQIKPIADSILEVKGKTFEDVISGNQQKGLNDFFG